MALFGDDEDDGRPQKKGFFSGIGDALWTAVKWVAIAAAAVLTLGAVFAFSKTARTTVDGWTGRDGDGIASTLADVYTGAVNKVQDLFRPNLKRDPKDDKKTEGSRLDASNVSFAFPIIVNSELVTKPDQFRELDDAGKAIRRTTRPTITNDTAKEEIKVLLPKMEKAARFVDAVERWNEGVDTHNKQNGVVKAPSITIKIPPLTEKLDSVGAAKFPDTWNNGSMNNIEKIIKLFETSNQSGQAQRDIKSTLDEWKKSDGFLGSAIRIVRDILPGTGVGEKGSINESNVASKYSMAFSAFSDPEGSDYKRSIIAIRSNVESLIEAQRFEEARIVSEFAAGKIEQLENDMTGKFKRSEDRTYVGDSKDRFADLAKKLREVEISKDLEPYATKVFAEVRRVAGEVPAIMKSYQSDIAKAASGVAPAPTTTTPPAPETGTQTPPAAGAAAPAAASSAAGAAASAPTAAELKAQKAAATVKETMERAQKLDKPSAAGAERQAAKDERTPKPAGRGASGSW